MAAVHVQLDEMHKLEPSACAVQYLPVHLAEILPVDAATLVPLDPKTGQRAAQSRLTVKLTPAYQIHGVDLQPLSSAHIDLQYFCDGQALFQSSSVAKLGEPQEISSVELGADGRRTWLGMKLLITDASGR